MTKQLLIYSSVSPLNRASHGDLAYKPTERFDFVREINAAPIMAAEFLAASNDFAIVFADAGGSPMPAILFGVKAEQNLFVGADGTWGAGYIPAFLRRWPFVFSADDTGETLTLCIDETAPGFNREGRGERLFDSEGAPTGFTNQMLGFLQEYQAQQARTKAFCDRLVALELLQTVEAHIPLPGEDARTLTGFQVVNREKLKALPAEVVEELFRADGLELIYLHLISMRNLERLRERALTALTSIPAAA